MATRRERVVVDADLSPFNRGMRSGIASARAFARELDSADSRMANIVQTGLALAPALAPLGGVAVAGVAALSAQLGFAAVGAATAVTALTGMGDALTALNDYQLDPTADNLEKVRAELSKLGPDARAFVFQLQEIRPALEGLRRAAQSGLLPGLSEGIDAALDGLPTFERLLRDTGEALGNLSAEAGEALSGPFWTDFFDFLTDEAPQALENMGQGFGNIAEGLAGLTMSLDPLSDDFSRVLLDMSEAFASWGRELGSSQGFAEFVDYVRTSGPQVAETLGALANALVDIAVAMAPLGGPTLQIIESLADVLAAVARSDVGPVLLGAAAGLAAVSRSIALFNAAQGSAFLGVFGGLTKNLKELRNLPTAGLGAVFGGLATDLDNFNSSGQKASATAGQLGRSLRAGGVIGAQVGGLAFVLSDLDEQLGLTNTAMLTLAGSMLGPLGAGAGAAAGALLDLRAANDEAVESMDTLRGLFDGEIDFQAQADALDQVRDSVGGFSATMEGLNVAGPVGDALNAAQGLFDDSADAIEQDAQRLEQTVLATREVVAGFAADTGLGRIDPSNLEDLTHAAELMRPAFAAAGLNMDDLAQRIAAGGVTGMVARAQFLALANGIGRNSGSYDRNTRSALANMRAQQEVAEGLLAAREGYRGLQQAIDDANKEAREGKRSLDVTTQAGRDNQAALDAIASAWQNMGDKAQQIPGRYKAVRSAFIDVAREMGLTREQAERLADRLIALPDPKVQIDTNAEEANIEINGVEVNLNALDGKTARTLVINTIRTVFDTVGKVANPFDGSADGGTVPRTGLPYADRHPYLLADGEEVISNRFGQADRHRSLLKAINAGRLADGGTAGGDDTDWRAIMGSLRGFGGADFRGELRELTQTLRQELGKDSPLFDFVAGFREEVARNTKALDRNVAEMGDLRSGMRDLKDAQRQFGQSVVGSLTNDPFAEGNSLGDALLQLRADRNDQRRFERAGRRARRLGLSGGAFRELMESGNLGLLRDVDTRREVRQLERLFQSRQRASRSLADFAGNAAFGQQIREQNKLMDRQSRVIDRLEKRLHRIEDRIGDRVEAGAARGTREGQGDRNRDADRRSMTGPRR